MNTVTRETPFFYRLGTPVPHELSNAEGSKLNSTYFEFSVTLPAIVEVLTTELSDSELLNAAEKVGTFDLLNDAQEDIYNDLLKKPE